MLKHIQKEVVMTNYKMTIAYDGSKYNGFQKQTKHPEKTIQGKLENVLTRLFDEEVQIIGSGRTDAGVHAHGQVCNFHTEGFIPVEKILSYLSQYLPQDIAILDLGIASLRFHSRYKVLRKRYVYTIDNNFFADPFSIKYAYHIKETLDIELMRAAATYLTGFHDFKSFTSLNGKNKSTMRHLFDIDIQKVDGKILLAYEGNGFLHHMVRILTGTLIEVGQGKRAPESMLTLLESKDRSLAGPTAPAHGLCMEKVYY